METRRDEHSIWESRWLGRHVDTPDGPGICSGFSVETSGIQYQVRTVNPEGVTVWKDFPKRKVRLIRGKNK